MSHDLFGMRQRMGTIFSPNETRGVRERPSRYVRNELPRPHPWSPAPIGAEPIAGPVPRERGRHRDNQPPRPDDQTWSTGPVTPRLGTGWQIFGRRKQDEQADCVPRAWLL